MQVSQASIRSNPDIETASEEEWVLACRRAVVLEALLVSGPSLPKVAAAAKELEKEELLGMENFLSIPDKDEE